MTTAQKFMAGLIAIGVVTAATLPGRQTVAVAGSLQKLVSGTEHTAITGAA